jgi:hypothetical protein
MGFAVDARKILGARYAICCFPPAPPKGACQNQPASLESATPFMKLSFVPLVVLALAVLLAGNSPASAAPLHVDQMLRLPDGREVKVLSVSRVEYSKGVMALMVRYQTTLSVDERKALSDEVDEVWRFAEKDVEHLGYSEAILSSNEVPRGIFITASRMLDFIYEKGPDGKWARLNRADFMAAQ